MRHRTLLTRIATGLGRYTFDLSDGSRRITILAGSPLVLLDRFALAWTEQMVRWERYSPAASCSLSVRVLNPSLAGTEIDHPLWTWNVHTRLEEVLDCVDEHAEEWIRLAHERNRGKQP